MSSCHVLSFVSNCPKALTDSTRSVNCIFKITFSTYRKQENLLLNPQQFISYLFRQVFLQGGAVFIFHPLSLWPLLGVSKQQGPCWMRNTRLNQ